MLLAPPLERTSSCASSASSAAGQSLISGVTASTAQSAPDLSPQPLPSRASLPLLDPSIKASTIRLPLQLPVPPTAFAEVEMKTLIVDDELGDAPVGFAVGKLRQLGSSLLTSTSATCLHIPAGPTAGPYLRCSFPPSRVPVPASYLPSHVLAIHSTDSPRTLLLPIHGLLWGATSPLLSFLTSRPEKQPPHPSLPTSKRPPPEQDGPSQSEALPVIELRLPSSSAFPLLQGWVYLRSPPVLLSALLPAPPKEKPSSPSPSIARLLNPTPEAEEQQRTEPVTSDSLTEKLSWLPPVTLLRHVHLVHGLWQDVVALQIGDEELWKAMGLAWRILVAALARRDQRSSAAALSTSAGTS
ncbi:hypothetical protein C6P46_004925 [Rhodotorula mucilaginosa]|uniref:Uncharacterized protein n=1 Tax=Rhodotorula mucilaginosa TaxID=5537 RepID=A0A9P6WA07_RHOMI|nr:hypothetical protein C6P46_004925 [Rhodotorula mucilaginosa]